MQDRMEKIALQGIWKAGNLIRKHLGKISAPDIHNKGPTDYVTEIDKQCESLIMDLIGGNFPDHHIMSEETASDGIQPGYTWVIDPLDGTTNFIHGFPFVAVSIAVCKDGKPVLGWILDPVRQELFSARLGGGAYLNGTRIRVRQDVVLKKAMVATGFPFRSRKLLQCYLASFEAIFLEVSAIRRAGAAALDLAYLAAGRVDGFWEIGLKAWDIAAGVLLVTEAGGLVADFWGEENYLYNGHIVSGTPTTFPFLLEQTGRIIAPSLASERWKPAPE
jgi:myo-inositol-1(or 4)-monophosphatase